MKCTECRKEVKPVVAIDIDGTLGNYHDHFLRFAADWLGLEARLDYTGTMSFKDWFVATYEVNNVTVDTWHDIKLAYRQGGMKRTMPVYVGARDLCTSVVEAGAELWITTTRPYVRHDNVDPDTREWLRRHGIPYHYLIYDGAKYGKLQNLVGKERVCAVLDDLSYEIANAEAQFGSHVPILRVTSFNSDDKGHTFESQRVTTLYQAERLIKARIDEWKEAHDKDK